MFTMWQMWLVFFSDPDPTYQFGWILILKSEDIQTKN